MTKAAQAPDEIAPIALMRALDVKRTTMLRALEAGGIPAPLGRTFGGHRRWTRVQLPEIVALLRARKRPVPPGWDADMRAEKKAKG